MSSVTVRYKSELLPSKEELTQKIIKVTSKLLNKRPEEVIVEYEPWADVTNAPDILIRAETSVSRQEILSEWGKALKEVVSLPNLRVAVKTYALISSWVE